MEGSARHPRGIAGFALRWGPSLEITGRSRGLRSPRGSSWPLIISAIAHRYAPLFEVGDLSTEKGNTDIGGLNFRGQPASHLFAVLRFWANYRCGAFLHNFRDARFQERSQQWDHSPTWVSGWFLVEMAPSELKIVERTQRRAN